MRHQVIVLLHKGIEFELSASTEHALDSSQARSWLDTQFVAFDCEPLRASGKVLTADKVLRVTEAAPIALFEDPKWSGDYAAAVLAALGKTMVRVDVPAMAVTY
jgi:hypothetical protein